MERSIFHEPWWLNATIGENWHTAVVEVDNEIIGEMPYTLTKKGFWSLSYLPPLTRTLGPVIKRQAADASDPDWSHRLEVTRKLIAQLPKCAHFQQVADPLVSEAEAAAFMLAGFKVSVQFTLKIPRGVDEETAWSRLRSNTRNRVRRSSERFIVQEISSVETFVNFYDSNLAARDLANVYGSTIMRRLLTEVFRRNAGTILGSFDSDGALVAATALVWDRSNAYYVLTTRQATAHSGAVALLVWQAMKLARERKLEMDFDGVSTAGILQFLAGFGGHLVRRYVFERMRADFAIYRGARSKSRELATFARNINAKKNAQAE
ncbi:acetyltransferase (GNAT) family protein [Paraburkholderia sp. RAU2J]|uniref:GNAT family N-acetyltransferase n=1 Tax=Paraburkholderia sp. RAU2J TaxID=1938810 RepID=UPI000F154BE4|nr:GNAT family N-acetyltransferase [Paraburkholderia sp. RAU2J]RKT13358.1 acetyltransferase (GNAT) family protein [Paraburkholderia sp. RAU2J]